jgi:hypothetical protein
MTLEFREFWGRFTYELILNPHPPGARLPLGPHRDGDL